LTWDGSLLRNRAAFVRGGVDVNARGPNGDNALHHLVRYGPDRVEPFANLVKAGTDPLGRNAEGQTPLALLRAEKEREKYFKPAYFREIDDFLARAEKEAETKAPPRPSSTR
jgi:hypothetical protein